MIRATLGLMAGGLVLLVGLLDVVRHDPTSPSLVVTTLRGVNGTAVYTIEMADEHLTPIDSQKQLDAHLMTVSPDGKWLIYSTGVRVYRRLLLGGESREVHFPKPDTQTYWYDYHQWSGDGHWLVAEVTEQDFVTNIYERALYRINIQSLRAERLSQHPIQHPHDINTFFYPTPSRDAVLYFGANDDGVDLYRAEIATGTETRLTSRLDYEYLEGWTTGGRWLIYWSPSFPTLFRVQSDGSEEQQLLQEANFDWLAYPLVDEWAYIGSYRDQVGGELYRVRWEGGDLQRLTTLEGYESIVALDEAWLYFVSGKDEAKTLYRMSPDGTDLEVVADGIEFGQAIGWSGNGTIFYYIEDNYSATSILNQLTVGSSSIQTIGEVYTASILMSPDHEWLVYKRVEDEHSIAVLETASGAEKLVDVSFDNFELFGWLPTVEHKWNPKWLLGSGVIGLLVVGGIGQLRNRH